MSETLSAAGMRAELRKAIGAIGSQRRFAALYGYSPSLISECLRGQRAIADDLAAVLGYERVTVYRRIKK